MTSSPIDPAHHLAPAHRDDARLLARIEQIAASVLRRLGDDPTAATRTNGWVNPGWMTDRHVIRVSLTPGRDDLRREVALALRLPAEVGYPTVVESGAHDGHDYLVTRRIDAGNLRSAWPDLDVDTRARAVRQMWERAEVVHAIETAAVDDLHWTDSPFFPNTADDAAVTLDHLAHAGLLDDTEHNHLAVRVDDFFQVRPSAAEVVCHGDLYTGNALWDGNHVVGLLDLEFAVIGPAEIDCNELTKVAFAHRIIDGTDGPLDPLESAVAKIARSIPADAALLTGYSVMLEAFLVAQELTHQSPERVAATKPARLLRALGRPDRGHLAHLVS